MGPLLDEAYVATGQVVHIFRFYPFQPNGMAAAKAAYCAGQQAPQLFWDMHDWLFKNQSAWSPSSDPSAQFRQAAVSAGADGARYDACIVDPATEARIRRDLQEGGARGVQGVPAFFINNWFISGAYPLEEFQDKIARAARGQSPPPAPTPLPPGVEFFDPDPARPGFTYDGSPSLGATDAKVILISFEDFKSAGSAEHASAVEPILRSKYVDSGQLRLVFGFFPDNAPRSAAGALCAARQGKFWEFRGQLYALQAAWTEGDDATLRGYATGLGLDGVTFDTCLADETVQGQLDASYQFGREQIGVPTTPSFLLIKLAGPGQIEDVKGFPGLQPLDVLEETIQELLRPQAQLPVPDGPISVEKLAGLPVGIDGDGNYYRGNLAAPIRLVDFSDFQ